MHKGQDQALWLSGSKGDISIVSATSSFRKVSSGICGVTTLDMKRLGLHDTTIGSFNNRTTFMYRAMPLPRHLLAKTRSFSGVRLFTPNSPCQFRGWSTLTKNRRFPRRLVSPRGNRSTRVINSSGSILAQPRNNGADTGST